MTSRFRIGRLLAAAFVAATVLAASAGAGAAQPVCPPNDPPALSDGFISGGLGLTCAEMVDLYGAPVFGQGSLIYWVGGVEAHVVRRGMVLDFTDGEWPAAARFPTEMAAAASFLPADAEYVGTVPLGTVLHSYQDAALYRSAGLAARYQQLGLARSGEILVVTTYEPAAMERAYVQRIELVSLELPA